METNIFFFSPLKATVYAASEVLVETNQEKTQKLFKKSENNFYYFI